MNHTADLSGINYRKRLFALKTIVWAGWIRDIDLATRRLWVGLYRWPIEFEDQLSPKKSLNQLIQEAIFGQEPTLGSYDIVACLPPVLIEI